MRSALVIKLGRSVHPHFPGQRAIADGIVRDAIAVRSATGPCCALNPERMSVHVVCELIGMPTHHVDRWVSLSTCKARSGKDVVVNPVCSERPLKDVGLQVKSSLLRCRDWLVGVRRVVDVGDSACVCLACQAIS